MIIATAPHPFRYVPSILLAAIAILSGCANGGRPAETEGIRAEPIALFNGTDIDDWVVKIRGYDAGDNYANTFRVEDGLLKVRYDGYGGTFGNKFGHLHYKTPYSRFRLVAEYRFVGDYLPDTPDWARRNSGVMFHGQDPMTLGRDQDFPISIEMQLLGGLGDGEHRPTGNMCSPGTDVVYEGRVDPRHCINSSSATYEGDQWVRVELEVLGDSLITHVVEGDTVLQYRNPMMGGGAVSGNDPADFRPGESLSSGYISVQSEGHPLDFRRIELTPLR
jgi:hypothetical protein